MATIWSLLGEMMVLVGDLLALGAAGASILALLGESLRWSTYLLRQVWSNALATTVLGGVGLLAKFTAEGMATRANGYVFGLTDTTVGLLLLLATASMGAGYWFRRQRPGG